MILARLLYALADEICLAAADKGPHDPGRWLGGMRECRRCRRAYLPTTAGGGYGAEESPEGPTIRREATRGFYSPFVPGDGGPPPPVST